MPVKATTRATLTPNRIRTPSPTSLSAIPGRRGHRMPHLQIHSRSRDGKLVPRGEHDCRGQGSSSETGEAGSVDLFATPKGAFAAVCAAAVLRVRPPDRLGAAGWGRCDQDRESAPRRGTS